MSAPRVVLVDEIARSVTLADAYDSALTAFRALADGTAVSPPPWHLEVSEGLGEVHVKGASIVGERFCAVKASSGFPGNVASGLPTSDGFSVVFDARTGAVAAFFLDGGYLTELRTGAAGALALDVLGPAQVEHLAVFGTGGQTRFQLESALRVRNPERVTIFGRSQPRAEETAAWLRERTDAIVHARPLGEDPIDAQAIITVTASTAPLFSADQVLPGTHISAMGADSPGKRELAPALLERADVVAVDTLAQSQTLGELQGVDLGRLRVVEMGGLLSNPFMRSDNAITICDFSGTGAQDAAIASIAAARVLD